MLTDALTIFRNMCDKTYELDPTKFISARGLAWQPALKKTKEKVDISTDIKILLMVECHSIY